MSASESNGHMPITSRRSVTARLDAVQAAAETMAAPAAATPAEPQKQRWTNDEVLAKLETAPAHLRVPGRTLLKGHTWDGRDIPGRGNAAARRLRQQQRNAERKAQA